MMGVQAVAARFFYDFCLDDHVPADHQLRGIDRHLDLEDVRNGLKPFYSNTGRPSVDPELMIRMLLIGYCMGIRSERRLCDEVHLNLAYRWFCRLGLDGKEASGDHRRSLPRDARISATLDDAAFGAATQVTPKFVSLSDRRPSRRRR